MQVLHERCCGLDIHKRSVIACVMLTDPSGSVRKESRTFGTLTPDLLAMSDWLASLGCTHVAMESTGVYWKPVYNLLEGCFALLVVNAQHIKAVPGRKTDVKDAEWIADLLRHGLLRGSFIPPAPQRELRELTRFRAALVQERATAVNRLQKVLEEANIKLASVVTNVVGVSARMMLEGLLAGQTDTTLLAELARGRLREKRAELAKALEGRMRPHHRLLVTESLAHLDYLEETIKRLSAEVEARLRPFQAEIERLDTIPGVNRRIAEVVLAEVGEDMSRFPDAKHLCSWAGVCPGNSESAGKRLSGKTRKGNARLRQALIEAAQGAARTKNTYLAAQYHRLAGRRGKKRALMAVAHTILEIIYYVLTRGEVYQDLGANYFDERDAQRVQKRLVSRLEGLGYEVTLQKAA